MSVFLPGEFTPYWTLPRGHNSEAAKDGELPKATGNAPEHAEKEQGQHHAKDALARVLHALHLHYYGESTSHGAAQPRVDVIEDRTTFTVLVELPGLDRNDVKLTADDHLFTLGFCGQLKRLIPVPAPAGDVAVEHKDDTDAMIEGHGNHERAQPERRENVEPGGERIWRVSERDVGSFHRVLQLPIAFVDMGAINARMANGLLTIVVPKRDEALNQPQATKQLRQVEISP